MKIMAIVSSQTNSKQTAFRTEAPLTEEVLGCALRDFWGENWANVYSAARGLFIVARTAIPKEQIPEHERTLSEAEKRIQKRKENAKKSRDDFLKGQSDITRPPWDYAFVSKSPSNPRQSNPEQLSSTL